MADNTTPKQRGGFAPGQSGNPAGRPKGARSKATLAVEALLAGEAQELTRVCVERAKAGDATALRLVMERICAPIRERAVHLDLPTVADIADLPAAVGRIVEAVASGELLPSEGQAIAALLGQQRQAFETAELAQRLDETVPEDDAAVIRVEIVGNPEHTRQIAKAAEEAARGRRADDRE
jgi:Family of unknown function (DUF5681)